MDERECQPDDGEVDGHEPSPVSALSLREAIDNESTAIIVTGLDGVIQRVTQTGDLFPADAEGVLIGETIVLPFAPAEHAFLEALLNKVSAAPRVTVGSFPVRLRGADDTVAYLSVSEIAGTQPGGRLLAWQLSPGDRMFSERHGNSELVLSRRSDTREAIRRTAEWTQRALAMARDTNRSLVRSLKSARELSDNQTAMFEQSSKTKDELVHRVREAWATAADARRSVDLAHQQLEFLNEVNQTLGQSLDFNTTLRSVASIVVPRIADCCMVHLLDDDRNILRRAVVACEDRSVADRMNARPEDQAGEDDDVHPLYRALRTGSSVVVHSPASGIANFLAQHDELSITSCIVTPLRSRDRIFGTITYASTSPERHYLPEDLLLAEEIAYRAGQSLDNAMLYRQAEEAAKMRERYLSMASHELRSPLTVVSGFGALILRQLADPEPDLERIMMLGHELQRGVERLELLTDGLLASGSLQSGLSEGSFVPVDLSALVEGSLTGMSSAPELVGSHTITFDGPDAVIGYCDAESIERAVLNIVSNALKYSPDGSHVHVCVYADEDVAAISVRDEGIGMSEEEQAELFSPFVRGRAARDTAQGSGLGLYIAKQIVEQHGGEIEVESQPKAGSTFTIHLPLPPAGGRADW